MPHQQYFPIPFKSSFAVRHFETDVFLFRIEFESDHGFVKLACQLNNEKDIEVPRLALEKSKGFGKYFEVLSGLISDRFTRVAENYYINQMRVPSPSLGMNISDEVGRVLTSNLRLKDFPVASSTVRFVLPVSRGIYLNGFMMSDIHMLVFNAYFMDLSKDAAANDSELDLSSRKHEPGSTHRRSLKYVMASSENSDALYPHVVNDPHTRKPEDFKDLVYMTFIEAFKNCQETCPPQREESPPDHAKITEDLINLFMEHAATLKPFKITFDYEKIEKARKRKREQDLADVERVKRLIISNADEACESIKKNIMNDVPGALNPTKTLFEVSEILGKVARLSPELNRLLN